MNTTNLKLLTIAGITATSLIGLPAMAKDGHGNEHAKGKAAYVSKDKDVQVQLKPHQSEKHKFKNGYSSNAQPNINAYHHANPNASFKRGLDKYDYRVVGKIDRDVYDRSVVLNRNEDGYVRIRTPENQVVTVINDTLQIIDILSK
ncbi:hypothetical protein Psyc_1433 [Psychrobacter arcticus 273-4]|uniref:Uncharacterized protein n=1 Tax=Psychrobacter arcticus (strain DSM 17307 / VKM B-2377 / 273-4) TaxID=259536 RepID=Q4FRS7_PSYA2|nr:hypothetical protein [Psychrobacter arcticus]AAZ19281.1 hypothetical protein Psyc_1433 [Psychrobacter arcticus 273-4]